MGVLLDHTADEKESGVTDWRQEDGESVCLWSGNLINGRLHDFYCSPSIEKITGCKLEQFYSRDKSRAVTDLWFQIIHPEDREEYRSAWKRAQQGKEAEIEYRIIGGRKTRGNRANNTEGFQQSDYTIDVNNS